MHNVALIIVAKNRLGYTGDTVLHVDMASKRFFEGPLDDNMMDGLTSDLDIPIIGQPF